MCRPHNTLLSVCGHAQNYIACLLDFPSPASAGLGGWSARVLSHVALHFGSVTPGPASAGPGVRWRNPSLVEGFAFCWNDTEKISMALARGCHVWITVDPPQDGACSSIFDRACSSIRRQPHTFPQSVLQVICISLTPTGLRPTLDGSRRRGMLAENNTICGAFGMRPR